MFIRRLQIIFGCYVRSFLNCEQVLRYTNVIHHYTPDSLGNGNWVLTHQITFNKKHQHFRLGYESCFFRKLENGDKNKGGIKKDRHQVRETKDGWKSDGQKGKEMTYFSFKSVPSSYLSIVI